MERSAGIIVFRREEGEVQFLLIKNAEHGHWDFPKGHINAGEDELEAALREAREEAGLKELKIIPDFRHAIHYEVKSKPKTVVYFLAETRKDTQVTLSAEHTEHCWLPLDAALKILQFDNTRRLLDKARDFLAGHHA